MISCLLQLHTPISIPLNNKTLFKSSKHCFLSFSWICSNQYLNPDTYSTAATTSKLSTCTVKAIQSCYKIQWSFPHLHLIRHISSSLQTLSLLSFQVTVSQGSFFIAWSLSGFFFFIFPTFKHWYVLGLSPGTSLLTLTSWVISFSCISLNIIYMLLSPKFLSLHHHVYPES